MHLSPIVTIHERPVRPLCPAEREEIQRRIALQIRRGLLTPIPSGPHGDSWPFRFAIRSADSTERIQLTAWFRGPDQVLVTVVSETALATSKHWLSFTRAAWWFRKESGLR
jgi:hypothetical protein